MELQNDFQFWNCPFLILKKVVCTSPRAILLDLDKCRNCKNLFLPEFKRFPTLKLCSPHFSQMTISWDNRTHKEEEEEENDIDNYDGNTIIYNKNNITAAEKQNWNCSAIARRETFAASCMVCGSFLPLIRYSADCLYTFYRISSTWSPKE